MGVLMILRIFFKSDKNSSATMSYLDVQAKSWSATPILLTVQTADDTIRYYPLMNVESFMEVQSES
jgi:hypothetical protein